MPPRQVQLMSTGDDRLGRDSRADLRAESAATAQEQPEFRLHGVRSDRHASGVQPGFRFAGAAAADRRTMDDRVREPSRARCNWIAHGRIEFEPAPPSPTTINVTYVVSRNSRCSRCRRRACARETRAPSTRSPAVVSPATPALRDDSSRADAGDPLAAVRIHRRPLRRPGRRLAAQHQYRWNDDAQSAGGVLHHGPRVGTLSPQRMQRGLSPQPDTASVIRAAVESALCSFGHRDGHGHRHRVEPEPVYLPPHPHDALATLGCGGGDGFDPVSARAACLLPCADDLRTAQRFTPSVVQGISRPTSCFSVSSGAAVQRSPKFAAFAPAVGACMPARRRASSWLSSASARAAFPLHALAGQAQRAFDRSYRRHAPSQSPPVHAHAAQTISLLQRPCLSQSSTACTGSQAQHAFDLRVPHTQAAASAHRWPAARAAADKQARIFGLDAVELSQPAGGLGRFLTPEDTARASSTTWFVRAACPRERGRLARCSLGCCAHGAQLERCGYQTSIWPCGAFKVLGCTITSPDWYSQIHSAISSAR